MAHIIGTFKASKWIEWGSTYKQQFLYNLFNVRWHVPSSSPSPSPTNLHWQTEWAATLIFVTGTIMGRMGCVSILPVHIMFVTVTVTESLGVYELLNFGRDEPLNFMSDGDCRTTQRQQRVVLSIEACSFIQRITGNIPSSGLSAKCLLARLRSVI